MTLTKEQRLEIAGEEAIKLRKLFELSLQILRGRME